MFKSKEKSVAIFDNYANLLWISQQCCPYGHEPQRIGL